MVIFLIYTRYRPDNQHLNKSKKIWKVINHSLKLLSLNTTPPTGNMTVESRGGNT